MRTPARLLLGSVLAVVALTACHQPPPVAEKPKRKSFEDSGSWTPAAPAAAPAPAGDVNAQAKQVQQSWEAAHQATDEAARQQAANDALNKTRQMADQPSSPTPH